MTSARAEPAAGGAASLVIWINRGLELLWLLTVALTPLVFLQRNDLLELQPVAFVDGPKIALVRTMAGLMAALWLLEWGLRGRLPFLGDGTGGEGGFRVGPGEWWAKLKGWLGGHPVRWVILSVWMYLGSVLLSTLLSASFPVSLWGEVPGRDSYAAYTIVAYVLLFFVVATHLRTSPQFWRLTVVIIGAGVVVAGYAVLQHYGIDFLQAALPYPTRAPATMGNPIFAAAVMLLSIAISLMAASINLRESPRTGGFWGKLALWTLVMAVQFLGIIFTLSRGPWVGAMVALAMFMALAGLLAGWRALARTALVLGVAAAVTFIVVWATPQAGGGTGETAPDPLAREVAQRFSSIGTQVTTGGLSKRLTFWQGSWRLMTGHPWFEFDDLSLAALRPLIGYGPDLFRSAYLLESPPAAPLLLPDEPEQAHNFLINQGVELGFLGLLSSLGVFASGFLAGAYLLLRRGRTYSVAHRLVLIGLLAALAGRFVEQMVGVARVSDLTFFWVILAMFVALPRVMASEEQTLEAAARAPAAASRRRPRARRSSTPAALAPDQFDGRLVWRLGLAVVLIAGIALLSWTKSVNYARATGEIRAANQAYLRGDFEGALGRLDRAIGLAPDVFLYYNYRSDIFSAYSTYTLQNEESAELECRVQNRLPYQACLAGKAEQSDRAGLQARPLHLRARMAMAQSSLALAIMTRDPDLTAQAVQLHRQALAMNPNSWEMRNRLASAYIQLGQPALALPLVEESLGITGETNHSAGALLLSGLARRKLGQPEQAVADYDRAIRLDPGSADAHNDRGNAYREQGRHEQAIVDYDESIRLDPGQTLAYANRAIAYTLLGDDAEARKSAERAIELGANRAALQEAIEEAKLRR